MSLSDAEQYLLELMNRARLNPAAEAARMGIGLNDGVSGTQISTVSKQVLAPNALLEAAAVKHSIWMLDNDIFNHTGTDGSDPDDRTLAEGYMSSQIGENIVFYGSTGTVTVAGEIDRLNRDLFLSADHRVNLMNASYREIGLGAEAGVFTQGGTNFNAAMLTEDFGVLGTAHFLTGVAYGDADGDGFYSMGEGRAGVIFRGGGQEATTAAAGGYALALGSGAATAVTGSVGAKAFALTVNMSGGNVKLDVVDRISFHTSGSVVLGAGLNRVVLLGVNALDATGNAAGNVLAGNAAVNVLSGAGGNDQLVGNGGADRLHGQLGADRLSGGPGADFIWGEAGNDTLIGGVGADVFIFVTAGGKDSVTDFSVSANDRLRLDDANWAGTDVTTAAGVVQQFATKLDGEVLIDFGNGQAIHLLGLTTLAGLAAHIEIF